MDEYKSSLTGKTYKRPALVTSEHDRSVASEERMRSDVAAEVRLREEARAKYDAQASTVERLTADLERERAGRASDATKIGELSAELLKRQAGYQAAIADFETKLLQVRESRATADMLAAQARAEADTERRKNAEFTDLVEGLKAQIEALMEIGTEEPLAPAAGPPPSYRVNVVGRDAAGDLRTLEIIPVERT